MDDLCSPQWVDFTCDPDVPLDDYFEKNHEAYEDNRRMEIPQIKIISDEEPNIAETPGEKIIVDKLEEELNIIKNTPMKVIYSSSSSHSTSKQEIVKQVKYDDIMQEAIETFEQCISAKKDIFKKPALSKNKATKCLKFHTVDNNQVNDLNKSNNKIILAKEDTAIQEIKVSPSSVNNDDHLIQTKDDNDKKPLVNNVNSNISPNILSKQNESDVSNSNFYTPTSDMKLLGLNNSNNKRQCKSLEKSSARRSKPLTYQCRRQSLKFRRNSNRYISLAAAVLKFQNQTPERFHTKSSKDINTKLASAKNPSSVTRKSMLAKSNLQKCDLDVNKKEEKKSNNDVNKDLENEKCTSRCVMETPKTINSRRSCVISSKKTTHNKNVVSTIVDNNGSGIILKKEKILFFDIPIHSKQKTTQPIPFSFENRDKAKKQSKIDQSQLKDNKLGNVEKSLSLQKKIFTNSSGLKNNSCSKQIQKNSEICKNLESTNALKCDSSEKDKCNDKKVIKNTQSIKGTFKTRQSISMSSLKSCGKVEDKSKVNEHIQNKATKQLKRQSVSMSSINSLNNNKDVSKNNQAKECLQVKKQSTLEVCKDKNRNDNKKTETLKIKNDLSKVKTGNNLMSANTTLRDKKRLSHTNMKQQENKPPNIDASIDSLCSSEYMKTKGITIGMNSYERAKQRQEFDRKMKEKLMMQEELRQKEEAERLAKEKLQISMIRKQLEVKARPMPIFKPPVVIKSTKQLTNPQSPAWSYKKKTKET